MNCKEMENARLAKVLFYVEILRQLKVAFEEKDFENLDYDCIIKAINKAFDVSEVAEI